jgi:hypothetical protein
MRSTGRLVGRLRCTQHCEQYPVALAGSLCTFPNEIDQWQNTPRLVFFFSNQMIRKRHVRIVGRECSS